MIADSVKAVKDILAADSSVIALVGTRVFGIELPQSEANNMPRKCIVIKPSGGAGFGVGDRDFVKHSADRVDIFYYGETPFEANKLRRTAYDVLKQVSRTVVNQVLVHWLNRAGGPIPLRDPDTTWPLTFESFQVFYAEEAVA